MEGVNGGLATTKEELKSRVNAKGFNIEELQLRPYGIISAINDFIAEGSLFNKQRFSKEIVCMEKTPK